MQHLSQRTVMGKSDIGQSMVEASNRAAIHFVVLSVAAVHLDHGGLVTIRVGIRGGAAECLGPVSGESLDMLGVEAVAEGMADHVVGHHPTMPGVGKAAQAVVSTGRFEDSSHAPMMTIVPSLCKMMAGGEFSRGNAVQRRPITQLRGFRIMHYSPQSIAPPTQLQWRWRRRTNLFLGVEPDERTSKTLCVNHLGLQQTTLLITGSTALRHYQRSPYYFVDLFVLPFGGSPGDEGGWNAPGRPHESGLGKRTCSAEQWDGDRHNFDTHGGRCRQNRLAAMNARVPREGTHVTRICADHWRAGCFA